MREHNRVAKELKNLNPHWDDEKLFQETRRIVIAEYQHIIYNEWLPIIVGKESMKKFNISPVLNGYSRKYEGKTIQTIKCVHQFCHVLQFLTDELDPRVTNEFATAAFRFGHSLIPSTFSQMSRSRMTGKVTLKEIFFKPSKFQDDKGF